MVDEGLSGSLDWHEQSFKKTIPYSGLLVSFGSFQRDRMLRNEDRKDDDDDTDASEMEEDRDRLITEN